MEPWEGRKRQREDDGHIDLQPKRRGSHNAAPASLTSRQLSPLPHRTGYYSRDSQILNERRLPPLYTSSCNTSAESATPHSVHISHQTQQPALLDNFRPRSHSLFNVFQNPHWQDHEVPSDASPPPPGIEVHLPRLGTDTAPHAAGEWNCCSYDCKGKECSEVRLLMRKLAAEVMLLEGKVRIVTNTEHHSPYQPPRSEHSSTKEALEQALHVVQCSNIDIQEHLDSQSLHTPEGLSRSDHSPSMRRGQQHLEEREERYSSSRRYPGPHHGYAGFAHPNMGSEDVRRLPFQGEMSSLGNSPHHTASSSGSALMHPQSPMQAPQPMRSAVLPSPSSLNFPNAPTLPSLSPPSVIGQASAQNAHLQDLQHQISVKTLAFQTLQREYDSLLQKLERQRTKCATLEKKFEVSDVEINSLTDEKERLQAQASTLENQVDELQRSRDEARQQLVANGAQYMRIMEMASKLQGQGAEDKKKWEAEKSELEQRIRVLEEAMVIGTERKSTLDADLSPSNDPSASSSAILQDPSASTVSQSETINVLRAEVVRLRSRTQTLEKAIQAMRQESISIQTAAQQLVQSGGKLENLAQDIDA